MFKSLLRTLPSLSGNVKLVCYINKDDIQTSDNVVYSTNVKSADLLPLSSNQINYIISGRLLKSTWDYDLKYFYQRYSDIFYNSTFEYNKDDIKKLNNLSVNKDRDVSFEFGCKRISYSKTGYQYAFFAPIYCEGKEDLPEYFNIDIELKNYKYSIKKTLKINICGTDSNNYLGYYLRNYYNKVNDNVVLCDPKDDYSIYYGISLDNGGVTTAKDYISSKIWKNQNTIHNVDALIVNGFKRNHMVMAQAIPLCFYFNVNDLLSKYELSKYNFTEAFISGYYLSGETIYDKYDFAIDYTEFKQPKFKYNPEIGLLEGQDSGKNIMAIFENEIGLNEGNYINYKYSNKLLPNICRWKLKYSHDEDPYILNSSWAFSNNQDDQCFYGMFPQRYDANINGLCDIIDNQYNLVLPIKNTIYKYLRANMDNNYNSYKELMNHYSFSWFTMIDHYSDEIYNDQTLWENINHDDKVYFRHVLYNLKEIYNKYYDCPKIDKFAVFGQFKSEIHEDIKDFKFSRYTVIPRNSEYIRDKKLNCNINNKKFPEILAKLEDPESDFLWFYEYDEYDDAINYNKIFLENPDGDFVDLIEEQPDGSFIDYFELNKYYDYDKIDQDKYEIYFKKDINGDGEYKDDGEDIYLTDTDCIIEAYVHLDITDLTQLQNIISIINSNQKNYDKIKDDLYISSKDMLGKYVKVYNKSKNKYELPELDKNETYDDKHFYQYYIYKRLVKSSCIHPKKEKYNIESEGLIHYMFNPILNDGEEIYAKNVFTIKEKENIFCGKHIPNKYSGNDNDCLWVDIYNLKNIFNNYLSEEIWDIYNNDPLLHKEYYANFLDKNHFYYYFQLLFKDHVNKVKEETILVSVENKNGINTEMMKDLYYKLKIIYIRERYMVNYNGEIFIRDKYTNIMNKFQELFGIPNTYGTINTKVLSEFSEILTEIEYIANGVFSYNEKTFELCYKSNFIKFTKEIDESISHFKNLNEKYKDLYLYTLKNSERSDNGILYELTNSKTIFNKTYVSINSCLAPLFNEVYVEPRDESKIYCQYNLSNIVECSICNQPNINRYTFFRYELDDFFLMYDISSSKETMSETWKDYTKYNINDYKDPYFYNTDDCLIYDNLLIKNINGINYGFYIIEIPIDNTYRSFNIISSEFKEVRCFQYINGTHINNQLKTQDMYNLLPFYKGNLYKTFNNISTVMYQSKIVYDILYAATKINDTSSFYDIKYVKNTIGRMLLYRYFNQIKPLILPQTNINNCWRLKFKTIDATIIKEDLIDDNNLTIYKDNLNINIYNPIKVFNGISNIPDEEYIEIEYKYFNDSKIINIPEEFEITLKKRYNKIELITLEEDENVKKAFDDYIKTATSFIDIEEPNTSDKLLFLYNKYSKSFITKDAGIDYLHRNKLYYLTYKFNLL